MEQNNIFIYILVQIFRQLTKCFLWIKQKVFNKSKWFQQQIKKFLTNKNVSNESKCFLATNQKVFNKSKSFQQIKMFLATNQNDFKNKSKIIFV